MANDGEAMDTNDRSNGDSSDDDNEDNDQEEAQNLARLMELEAALKADPYHYQSHVDRVDVLKRLGELDQLRSARESFAQLYPLSSELWLSWLRDEQGLAATDEDRQRIFELFSRAVRDYASVEVWLEYCQFSLCGLASPEGVARARTIFEEAITAVGIHVGKGSLIWEAYREFESALAALAATDEVRMAEQMSRVDKVFRRQLTVPLLEMDSTMEEYRAWLSSSNMGEAVDKGVEAAFLTAKKLLSEREELENALLRTQQQDLQHLAVYTDYLALESKAGLPVRIQSLHERRIVDHCLVPSVWSEYLEYLDFTLKVEAVSLSAHERSIRNCPWSGDLWVSYLRALERCRQERKSVVRVFEQAVSSGFGDPAEYLKLWLAFLDYRRRSGKKKDDEEEEKEEDKDEIRTLFAKAVDHLAQVGGDPECKVARYWAWVEGDLFRSMEEARKMLSGVMVGGELGDRASLWMEYIHLEKACGDTKHLRKLFPRALERCRDTPEIVGQAWVQFEREEGNLEDVEEAEKRFGKKMEKTREERAKEQRVENERSEKRKDRDKDRRREKRHMESEQKSRNAAGGRAPPPRKRKAEDERGDGPPVKSFAPDFKMPPPPPGLKSSSSSGAVAPPPGYKANSSSDNSDEKEARTVFVSNLDYSVTEEILNAAMASSGDISEVRLVKNPAGKSKGFAYVEFAARPSAVHAISRDHEPLLGRPMFVSACDPEKKLRPAGHHFKYGVGLEKNKLFVKGLPLTATKEDLEAKFGEFGKVKEVRVVTYRNGHSKGIAFVEFEEASSASQAIMRTDGSMMEGSELSVAISNPPERSRSSEDETAGSSRSLGGGSRMAGGSAKTGKSAGVGGVPRMQMALLPRALMKKAPSSEEPTNGSSSSSLSSSSASSEKPKSNADFRNMLLKGSK